MTDHIFPGPEITFTWSVDGSPEKFMHVEEHPDGVKVTMHPGLSRDQVMLATGELGEHGPAILRQWERHTGFTS